MPRTTFTQAAALSVLVLGGCGTAPEYYPIEEGATWEYRFEFGNNSGQTLTERVTGTAEFEGRQYYRVVRTWDGNHPDTSYLRRDPAGVFRRTPQGEFLILPSPMKVGTTWRTPWPEGPADSRVDSREDVQIGNRLYRNCLRIKTEQPTIGTAESRYCPGVGLVSSLFSAEETEGHSQELLRYDHAQRAPRNRGGTPNRREPMAVTDEKGVVADAARLLYTSLSEGNSKVACDHYLPCRTMDYFESDMQSLSVRLLGRITDVSVDVADVTGPRAIVNVSLNGGPAVTLEMNRINGVWKFADQRAISFRGALAGL